MEQRLRFYLIVAEQADSGYCGRSDPEELASQLRDRYPDSAFERTLHYEFDQVATDR